MPRKPPRFFLAHAKSCDDAELDRLTKACAKVLDTFAAGRPFDLILGRAYFEARFKEAGSWAAWTAEVANGVDYLTREPNFTAIMIPEGPIGAGTAKIVEGAVAGNRPVYAFDDAGRHRRVVGLTQTDPKNWQTGWKLVLG